MVRCDFVRAGATKAARARPGGLGLGSTSPGAPLKPLLNQGDETLGVVGEATMKAPNDDIALSCLGCSVEFFDVGHRTSRRGFELFDTASNFST